MKAALYKGIREIEWQGVEYTPPAPVAICTIILVSGNPRSNAPQDTSCVVRLPKWVKA